MIFSLKRDNIILMAQKGFTPIIIVIIIALAGTTTFILRQTDSFDKFKNGVSQFQLLKNINLIAVTLTKQDNAIPLTPQPSTSKSKITPTLIPSKLKSPTSTPTIPPIRNITLAGFAYEDRNDDGIYNSDDPKLPYMQFYFYDSYDQNKQISTVFTELGGHFSITLPVRNNLIIKPTTYNNFRPRGDQQGYSQSNNNLQIAFRSASAPVVNQVGIIEGDVFQDNNQNGIRDSGEQGIYFYKLYLIDDRGNYYENSSQNAQATDAGGHFKYMNLPIGRSFILRLSNPTGEYIINRPETTITLTNTNTENTNVQIPIFKN